ncbi:MAG TPA: serine/threonine-protein kinase [Nannocystaceae bacterium]|nr:serine/threonine-protein kinase [Nannocystaceae bacterium]
MSADGSPRGRLVGRYELLHRLGHGGMATVYLGRAVGTAGFEKLVAVKVIHPHLANEPDFVEMFLDEARIAARIRHPHVVEILDLGREDDVFFMVMEYVEGDTLASLVKELRKAGELLPVPVLLRVVADACEGLAAAHDLVDPDGVPYHLVHRDVSPHNLLVGLDGRVRVVDFGIMKAAGKRSTTLTGQLRGKLPYMSPEQARGQQIDRRTDLFALGAVLWELITNERLFGGETDSEILTRVCDCEIPDITKLRNDLPPELVRVVQRALSPDLERRYRDAHEMLRDVRTALRACEGDDPRDGLSAVMKRYFDARIEYVRAAARGRGIDRPNERERRSSVHELDAVARSAAEGLADPLRTPTSVIPGRSSSGLREFPEVPTALTPVTGTVKPARQWTLWVLLPLLGAAAATIAVTLNRKDGEARAATPPVESPMIAAERGNEGTTAGEDADTVKWYLRTDPPGATVVIDGVRQAKPTPLKVELPKSDEPLAVRFELAGFHALEESLAPVASQNLPVYSLARIEAEPAATPKATTNTNIRFTAKKPKGKPKAGAEATTPSKPGPAEATPAPDPGTPKTNPDGELSKMPDLKGDKPRVPGG